MSWEVHLSAIHAIVNVTQNQIWHVINLCGSLCDCELHKSLACPRFHPCILLLHTLPEETRDKKYDLISTL
jgi:hypothetical protein